MAPSGLENRINTGFMGNKCLKLYVELLVSSKTRILSVRVIFL